MCKYLCTAGDLLLTYKCMECIIELFQLTQRHYPFLMKTHHRHNHKHASLDVELFHCYACIMSISKAKTLDRSHIVNKVIWTTFNQESIIEPTFSRTKSSRSHFLSWLKSGVQLSFYRKIHAVHL